MIEQRFPQGCSMAVSPLDKKLQVIRELSNAMAHSRDVRVVLEHLLGSLGRQMDMQRAMMTLRYGDELVIEVSDGLDEREQKLGHYRLGEGIVGHVAETGRPHIIPDVRKDKRFLNRTRSRGASEAVAFICVPLFHQNEVIGTLSVDRKLEEEPGGATDLEQDAAFLETVGNMAADAAFLLLREQEEQTALREENRQLRDLLDGPEGMIGHCREMLLVAEQIRQVAPSDATVLIRGASGTGKELVARAIVRQSARRNKPFISLNCAVLPEDLVESELFGHEKGAFTGAVSRRLGRAEEADGGTLFLDEIGDLSPRVQVKLLRFLQERTFSRLGSNTELHADVRFLAATSRDLELLMREGKFREDLYYRLNIFPIFVPELSKRKGDILLLAEHFIRKMNLKYQKSIKGLSPPAMNMLMEWHWPGNVRELENCMERAVLTANDGDFIQSWHLPPVLGGGKAGDKEENEEKLVKKTEGIPTASAQPLSLAERLQRCEREILVETLRKHGGNLSAAGRELGVSPRMMSYRVSRLGITREDFA